MLDDLDETIVAIASPPGGGARGIVRLSGPDVRACLVNVFQGDAADEGKLAAIRHPTAIPGRLRLDGFGSSLPCELYFWPTSRSFTGEPAAEIHTLGSMPLLEAVLHTLCAAGARLARPGEFTLRAFLAGRIDLTQAEAVLGIVDAADPSQLQVALAQLAGGLARPLGRLRDTLLDLLAELEAGFDFAHEDLTFITSEQLQQQVCAARHAVARLAQQMASRRDSADLVRVVLRGWPNTGKSSLFNALLGKTVALVSQEPGTTRDYLTAELSLGGVKCVLVDTAGTAPEPDGRPSTLWQAAQDAASHQSRLADLQLLCLDSSRPLNLWERSELAADLPNRILVLTKCDAPRRTDLAQRAIATSSLTGEGIATLRQRLSDAVATARAAGCGVVAGTAARCYESIRLAAECLDRAGQLLQRTGGEELVAAEIRAALAELGKTIGTVYTDDILDRIFSRFCIGK